MFERMYVAGEFFELENTFTVELDSYFVQIYSISNTKCFLTSPLSGIEIHTQTLNNNHLHAMHFSVYSGFIQIH